MAPNPALLKERTRIAQRKSREKRKRNIESLRLQNEVLLSAVNGLVKNNLLFSDVVIDSLRDSRNNILQPKLKLFIKKTLDIAQLALGHDDADTQSNTIAPTPNTTFDASKTSPLRIHRKEPDNSLAISRKVTQAKLYGILPSLSGCTTPPLDTIDNLDPQSMPFAALLFWNTMAFSRVALDNPASPITRGIFSYAMMFTTAERQRNQIARRLRFRPTSIQLLFPLPGSALLTEQEGIDADITTEVKAMQRDFENIEQAMVANDDSMASYLDAAGVEDRLQSHWGLDIKALAVMGAETDKLRRALAMLIRASRCVGNKPGFKMELVDASAIKLLGDDSIVGSNV